jgi:predicted DNA-binding transcriptional regulator YafY
VIDPRGWRRQAEEAASLSTVEEAVWSDRQLRILYRAAGRSAPRQQVVHPWGVVVKAGIWYLIAALGGEPRLYRVARVEEAQVLEQPADRPQGLDLEAVWRELRRRVEEAGPGVEVMLRVRAERLEMLLRLCAAQLVGPVVRDTGPHQPAWSELQLTFVAEGAARAVLVGFGADVEVLAPESLRLAMVETARQVLEVYATQPADYPRTAK